jgi:single-strand DNA-binding protein
MPTLNRVVLIGRLTRDPESRFTPSGVEVVTIGLAVTDPFRRKTDGSGDYETNFFNVIAWRQNAEYARNYLRKGRLVAVDGRLQQRSWIAQDGTRRSVVEIVADRVEALDRPREEPVVEDFEAAEPVEPYVSEVSQSDFDIEEAEMNDPFGD